jgi:hemolysin activation/secretion protein
MKMTSDSAIKNQINQIAAQIKWLKTQEANASKSNLPLCVKSFQNNRKQLVHIFNSLIGSSNSVKGIKYGARIARKAWLASKENRRVDGTPIYTR